MTSEELEAIRGRERSATAGPWEAEVTSDTTYIGPFSGKRGDDYEGGLPVVDGIVCAIHRKCEGTLEDGYFIAHARTDIPALLAEVERLKRLTESALDLCRYRERDIERLQAVLKEVEWLGGEFDGYCPACGQGQGEPHSKRCSLARALKGEAPPCSA